MELKHLILAGEGRRSKLDNPYSYDPFTTYMATTEPDGSVYTDRLFQ